MVAISHLMLILKQQKFVKVMPLEYRRALEEMEKAQSTSDGMTIGMKKGA